MQSGQGAPTISLQLVPKMLSPLVSLWVPQAFVVSFKLETDESLLITKARDSLSKYRHKVSSIKEKQPILIHNQLRLSCKNRISMKKGIAYCKYL